MDLSHIGHFIIYNDGIKCTLTAQASVKCDIHINVRDKYAVCRFYSNTAVHGDTFLTYKISL